LRTIDVRPAVVGFAGIAEARHVVLQRVIQIVAHEQVDETVAIEIKKRRRHAPRAGIVGAARC
jgi:hypothetical protein